MKGRLGRIALTLLGMILIGTNQAVAAEIRNGPEAAVGSGEVIHDDVYLAGNTVEVDGTVDGDLFVIGGTVVINGAVTGSVNGVADTITISGPVSHSARLVARTLDVSNNVGGDALIVAQTASLTGPVGRDLMMVASTLNAAGGVGRDVRGMASDVTLGGRVNGNVNLSGVDQLALADDALIQGDVRYESLNTLTARDARSQISGQTERRAPAPQQGDDPVDRLLGTLFSIVAITLVGAVGLALSPRAVAQAGFAVIRTPLLSLGWGFGLLIGIPIAAGLFILTVVGIPVAMILLVAYAAILYASQAVVGLAVGRYLLSQLRPVEGYLWLVVSVFVGTLILAALRALPVVGSIATALVLILGLGAVWMAYLDARGAGAETSGTSEPTPVV